MNSENSSMDSKKDMPAIRVTEIAESGHNIANLNKPSLMKVAISTESKSNSLYLNSGLNCESDVETSHLHRKHTENSYEDSDFLCLPASGQKRITDDNDSELMSIISNVPIQMADKTIGYPSCSSDDAQSYKLYASSIISEPTRPPKHVIRKKESLTPKDLPLIKETPSANDTGVKITKLEDLTEKSSLKLITVPLHEARNRSPKKKSSRKRDCDNKSKSSGSSVKDLASLKASFSGKRKEDKKAAEAKPKV